MSHSPDLRRIAILGSGAGTNARAICEYAQSRQDSYRVALIVSTSETAGMCSVARDFDIELMVLPPTGDYSAILIQALHERGIELLALAGFMRLLPSAVIEHMRGNVLNIHPALLPAFGGKGMYGIRVHQAVLDAQAPTTGATVHLVSPMYDEGAIIAQSEIAVPEGVAATELQGLVKQLEHSLYPAAISAFLRKK